MLQSQRWPYAESCSECGGTLGKRRAKGLCHSCYHKKYTGENKLRMLELSRESYHRHAKTRMQQIKARRAQRRMEMIRLLGGKCACCGETEPIFLCLDHIKKGGRREYEKAGGPHGVWRRAIAEGLPKDKYRLLCWNCNSALGLFGYCPHSSLTSPVYRPPILIGSEKPSAEIATSATC